MPSASKQDKNNVFPNNLIRSICTVSRLRITDKQFHFFILLSHLQYNNFDFLSPWFFEMPNNK